MQTVHRVTASLAVLATMASCGAPPTPPTVDESTRRPANSASATELQVCRHQLRNAQLTALEAGQIAQGTLLTMAGMATSRQAVPMCMRQVQKATSTNRVHTALFEFARSRVTLQPEALELIVNDAKSASVVVLRGRTDGVADSVAESRMSRDRAVAVRDVLLRAGIDPARIRTTYQPVGDHVADNSSPAGRALNRRVEIEIYPMAPTMVPSDWIAR